MRILLAEDDRRIATDVAKALRANGYVVEAVSDGEEAWFRGIPKTTLRSSLTSDCRKWMACPF